MLGSKLTAVTAVCLAVAAVAVAYAMGSARAPATKVMRAERFELVDSAGKATAVLTADPDGLAIRDPQGKVRAIFGMAPDRAPALGLLDGSGWARISMDMTSDGSAELSVGTKSGKAVAHLGVLSDGTPSLSLDGPDGRGVVAIRVADDGSGRLAVYDGPCHVAWQAP
jgi:hypothetical protein